MMRLSEMVIVLPNPKKAKCVNDLTAPFASIHSDGITLVLLLWLPLRIVRPSSIWMNLHFLFYLPFGSGVLYVAVLKIGRMFVYYANFTLFNIISTNIPIIILICSILHSWINILRSNLVKSPDKQTGSWEIFYKFSYKMSIILMILGWKAFKFNIEWNQSTLAFFPF